MPLSILGLKHAGKDEMQGENISAGCDINDF